MMLLLVPAIMDIAIMKHKAEQGVVKCVEINHFAGINYNTVISLTIYVRKYDNRI